MQLPFFGKIQPDEDDGFKARLTGFLIRETSQKECYDFMEARKDKLWEYDGQGRFAKFRKTIVQPNFNALALSNAHGVAVVSGCPKTVVVKIQFLH